MAKMEIYIYIFFGNAEFYRVVWTINALLTVHSEMLPFSGNNQNINIFGVPPPPEHFAIGYWDTRRDGPQTTRVDPIPGDRPKKETDKPPSALDRLARNVQMLKKELVSANEWWKQVTDRKSRFLGEGKGIPTPTESGGTYACSQPPEPPPPPHYLGGKIYPYLGNWSPQAITKNTLLPGFLWKSSENYTQNTPLPFRENGNRHAAPLCIRVGVGGGGGGSLFQINNFHIIGVRDQFHLGGLRLIARIFSALLAYNQVV